MVELNKEKAILVALKTSDISSEKVNEQIDELEKLAETAGAQTVFKIIQVKNRRDPAHFIGKGKAEEIAELAEMNDINLLIFDDDLTATQVRNLERLIGKKILDRSGLILDIFASHAKTRQAKTQVELAQLQYLLPRLTRAWTHLSKQHGGIGTKGPGETQIETDRRMIRLRISKLKEKLKKIESQQVTKGLKRKDFITASLVGYTNAGKSTILNLLTDADVLVEDKLFATLDSITRSLELAKNKNILISDTVGFIRKLPHHLIESFKSTLSVVREADLILHVIDITHQFFEDHIHIVEETLKELNGNDKTVVKIFNKIDLLDDKNRMEYVRNRYPDALMVSATRGINIQKLHEMFLENFEKNFMEMIFDIPIENSKEIAQVYELADVLNVNYEDDKVNIRLRASKQNADKIKRLFK
ncbi:MAG: GTPase HflX [Chlorobi bacterium]|nr:GTPase HflX [Chlorobiota bacterium]